MIILAYPHCNFIMGCGNECPPISLKNSPSKQREGSFSSAAKRLGVQHSTVSRRIRALEQKLATPLVERKAFGYVLIEAGEELKVWPPGKRRPACIASQCDMGMH